MTNEDKPLFRVGGVYRDGQGRVIKLIDSGVCHYAIAIPWDGEFSDNAWHRDGGRRYSDGRYIHDHRNDRDDIALIPGELELRDGQWVPVEEKEEEVLLNGLTRAETDATASVMGLVSTALPPLRSLTLSTDLEPASHQVKAAFGSAELVRR